MSIRFNPCAPCCDMVPPPVGCKYDLTITPILGTNDYTTTLGYFTVYAKDLKTGEVCYWNNPVPTGGTPLRFEWAYTVPPFFAPNFPLYSAIPPVNAPSNWRAIPDCVGNFTIGRIIASGVSRSSQFSAWYNQINYCSGEVDNVRPHPWDDSLTGALCYNVTNNGTCTLYINDYVLPTGYKCPPFFGTLNNRQFCNLWKNVPDLNYDFSGDYNFYNYHVPRHVAEYAGFANGDQSAYPTGLLIDISCCQPGQSCLLSQTNNPVYLVLDEPNVFGCVPSGVGSIQLNYLGNNLWFGNIPNTPIVAYATNRKYSNSVLCWLDCAGDTGYEFASGIATNNNRDVMGLEGMYIPNPELNSLFAPFVQNAPGKIYYTDNNHEYDCNFCSQPITVIGSERFQYYTLNPSHLPPYKILSCCTPSAKSILWGVGDFNCDIVGYSNNDPIQAVYQGFAISSKSDRITECTDGFDLPKRLWLTITYHSGAWGNPGSYGGPPPGHFHGNLNQAYPMDWAVVQQYFGLTGGGSENWNVNSWRAHIFCNKSVGLFTTVDWFDMNLIAYPKEIENIQTNSLCVPPLLHSYITNGWYTQAFERVEQLNLRDNYRKCFNVPTELHISSLSPFMATGTMPYWVFGHMNNNPSNPYGWSVWEIYKWVITE
jgi:hypothetical protein